MCPLGLERVDRILPLLVGIWDLDDIGGVSRKFEHSHHVIASRQPSRSDNGRSPRGGPRLPIAVRAHGTLFYFFYFFIPLV